jgi:hypothetical protein
MFTLKEIRLLMEGIDTLISEYGQTPERLALFDKLRTERDSRLAEIEEYRM